MRITHIIAASLAAVLAMSDVANAQNQGGANRGSANRASSPSTSSTSLPRAKGRAPAKNMNARKQVQQAAPRQAAPRQAAPRPIAATPPQRAPALRAPLAPQNANVSVRETTRVAAPSSAPSSTMVVSPMRQAARQPSNKSLVNPSLVNPSLVNKAGRVALAQTRNRVAANQQANNNNNAANNKRVASVNDDAKVMSDKEREFYRNRAAERLAAMKPWEIQAHARNFAAAQAERAEKTGRNNRFAEAFATRQSNAQSAKEDALAVTYKERAAERLAQMLPWEIDALRRNHIAKLEKRAQVTGKPNRVAKAMSKKRAARAQANAPAPQPVVVPHVPNSLAPTKRGAIRFSNPHKAYRVRAQNKAGKAASGK